MPARPALHCTAASSSPAAGPRIHMGNMGQANIRDMTGLANAAAVAAAAACARRSRAHGDGPLQGGAPGSRGGLLRAPVLQTGGAVGAGLSGRAGGSWPPQLQPRRHVDGRRGCSPAYPASSFTGADGHTVGMDSMDVILLKQDGNQEGTGVVSATLAKVLRSVLCPMVGIIWGQWGSHIAAVKSVPTASWDMGKLGFASWHLLGWSC